LLLYYITDRTQFPGDERTRRRLVLERIGAAARAGVDFIQLREKDLSTRELEKLACAAREAIENSARTSGQPRARLLINSRSDVALAWGADGVHLRSDDVDPATVREIWKQSGATPGPPVIGVSCHSVDEVGHAASQAADFAVFAPVFEKRESGVRPAGLDSLREACRVGIPVLALGGVTLDNAGECLRVGAAGVAGIRLFQESDLRAMVNALRSLQRIGP